MRIVTIKDTDTRCERCETYIVKDLFTGPYQLKVDSYKHDLCGMCIQEIKRQEWDKSDLK